MSTSPPSEPAPVATVPAEPGDPGQRPTEVGARRPAWPPRGVELAIIFGYVLLAVWIMRRLLHDPAHYTPETNTSDPAFFEWALVHAARIFTHGENPFFTARLNAPLGVNMMANTGLLGLTVPLVPVTLLFGPSASLVLMLTLGLAATATAWYYVLSRHIVPTRHPIALVGAALGGLFCGFGPGMVNHANSHPNLVAQFLIPFIIWRVLVLAQPVPDQASPRRTYVRRGVALGLLVTWQAFLNEELLFLIALAMAIFVAAYAASRPAEVRAALRPFLPGAAVAVAVAGLLLAGPLWFQFFGPQHYRGLPDFVLGYGSDLASYPAFAKLSLVGGDGHLANQPEENSFLGWPLLLTLPVIAIWLWRRPAVRALSAVGVVFAVLSLGQTLTYEGRQLTTRTPWGVLDKLPLFDTVVPTRLALVVIPVVGLLLALTVDRLRTAPPVARYAWLAVLVAVLLPIAPRELPVAARPPVPVFFTSGDWHRYVTGDESVVSADTTIWNGGIDAMHWDTATGQGYLSVGGYFLGPDGSGRGTYGPQYRPTAVMLYYVAADGGVPPIGDAQRAQLAADVKYWRAAVIVLAPDAPHWQDLYDTLVQLVGPGQNVDDVWLWNVRPLRSG